MLSVLLFDSYSLFSFLVNSVSLLSINNLSISYLDELSDQVPMGFLVIRSVRRHVLDDYQDGSLRMLPVLLIKNRLVQVHPSVFMAQKRKMWLQVVSLFKVHLNWQWMIGDMCNEEIWLLIYPFMVHKRKCGF